MRWLSRLLACALLVGAVCLLGDLRPANAQTQSDSIDVVLVVDNSGSMRNNDPDNVRISAAKLFVDLSSDGDRLAVVSMSGKDGTRTRTLGDGLIPMSRWLGQGEVSRKGVKDTIGELSQTEMGGTYMGKALTEAYNILDKTEPGRRQFVIFLTDGQHEADAADVRQLDTIMGEYVHKRFWKVFSIALGDGADPQFLDDKISKPTGGQTFKAQTPEDLIRIYTELFAMLRYNRYVNFIKLKPNVLQTLATVTPEQRITNLALVIPERDRRPRLDLLVTPANVNVVDPANAGGVYHAEDPRYDCYVLETSFAKLDGEWKARLLSDTEVEVAVLVRSDLGIQLIDPPGQESWDELSDRFAPAGKPLFVRVGPRNSPQQGEMTIRIPGITPEGIQGALQTALKPAVKMIAPSWPTLALNDKGTGADLKTDDGEYTGVYQTTAETKQYTLEAVVPVDSPQPLRLSKQRTVTVLNLPTINLQLSSSGTVAPKTPIIFTINVQQPKGEQLQITSTDLTVLVREPDGGRYTVDANKEGEVYNGSFTPRIDGEHVVSAIASMRVVRDGREIAYTDYAEGKYGAVAQRTLKPVSEKPDLGSLTSLNGQQVKFTITSDSPIEENVKLRVVGIEAATIFPAEVVVPPQETTTFSVRVATTAKSLTPGKGAFKLVLTPDKTSLKMDPPDLTYSYEASDSSGDVVLLLGLGACCLVLIFVVIVVFVARRYLRGE